MSESSAMPPTSTAFGGRVARRLREEKLAWLTTVGEDGTPQPNPVWFLWEGDTILMYSLPHAARVANIKRNPRVSFNFDGDGRGGNIIVIGGEARICPKSRRRPRTRRTPQSMPTSLPTARGARPRTSPRSIRCPSGSPRPKSGATEGYSLRISPRPPAVA